MFNTPVGFRDDHFIYQVHRPSKGRGGRCSRCAVSFETGDHVRIAGDLNDLHGWWHESCPKQASSDAGSDRG